MHTKDKLAAALTEANLPELAERAAKGGFDDFMSDLPLPMITLVDLLAKAATRQALDLRKRVINGEFDSTAAEAEAWANSPDGQATFAKFLKREP
jgi:hypothetical protein